MTVTVSDIPTHWVMVPAPWRVGAQPAAEEQRWLLTLTGVARVDFKGDSGGTWNHETFWLKLDCASALRWAYGQEPPLDMHLAFVPEQWAPFATLNSVYDAGYAVNAGFAVDSCDINRSHDPVTRFNCLEVVVGVRDTDAHLYAIGFQVTMLGRIALVQNVQ